MRTLLAALILLALGAAPAAAAPALTASVVGEPPNGGGVLRFPQAVAYSPGGATVVVGDQFSARVSVFGAAGDFRFGFGAHASRREPSRIGVVGGVATDREGRIFVLDSENDRIQVFSPTGTYVTSFGDASIFDLLGADPEAGGGISAGGIAVGAGAVYVADPRKDRVARVPFDGATFGTPAFSAVDLAAPQGLALNPAGTSLYVADDVHDRVVVLDPLTLALRTAVGSHGSGPGQFDAPYDVAVDGSRRLYVADNLNGRVGVFDADSLAWLGAFGRPGRGLAGTLAFVRSVGALADDPRGGVVVTDTANDRVQTFDTAGTALAAWGVAGRGPGYVTRPRGVAFAPGGGVAVADTFDHRIERIGADGAYAGQFGLVSSSTGYTTGGSAAGQFMLPQGVAYDAGGMLWVADTGNDRVVELDANGAVVRTIGGLANPRGVAAGRDGGVLIADTGHGEVLEVNGESIVPHGGFTRPSAVAFDGTSSFVADENGVGILGGGPVAPPGGGAWDLPSGLAAGPGVLYVSERRLGTPGGARVVRRAAGVWDAVATEGAGAGQVIEPSGLALSPDGGTLLVADAGNNRVLRLDAPGVTPPQPPGLSVAVDTLVRGQVTSDRPGIACPTDCGQHFGAGSAVTLTATPISGSVFAGWGGACAGTAPTCVVTIGGETTVSASFAAAPPPPPAPTPVPPTVAPPPPAPVRMTGLRISPRTLRKQARVTVRLSRPATLTVTTQAGREGRRRGSRCVAPTRALRGRARCTRFVALPGQRSIRAGGTVAFTLKRGKLRPGRYRLAITALDRDGNRVGPATVAFRVRYP